MNSLPKRPSARLRHGLQSFRSIRRMDASFKNARALRLRFFSLGEAAAAVEPGDRAFDDPTLGQLHEAFCLIGSFDDFGFEAWQDFGERVAATAR